MPSENRDENLATEPRVFKQVDSFIQQLDNFEVEVKPEPTSQKQIIVADKLSVAIALYRATTEQYKTLVRGCKVKDSHEGEYETRDEYEREKLTEALQELTPQKVDEAWQARYDAASNLHLCITQAKTHGMVHQGPDVLKQLKQCREDNAKLSAQILEYKNKLGIRN